MKITESKLRKIIRKIIKEGFAGPLSSNDRKSFEKMRERNAEVLGYSLTGVKDTRSKIGNTSELSEAIKLDYDKVKKMVDKDKFLARAFKAIRGSSKAKLSRLFTTFVLGDPKMEKIYNKIK